MEKKKILDPFDFIFSDKVSVEEALFNEMYNPLSIRNNEIVYNPPLPGTHSPKCPMKWLSGSYDLTGYLCIQTIGDTATPTLGEDFPYPRNWQAFKDYASFQEILDGIEPLHTEEDYKHVHRLRDKIDYSGPDGIKKMLSRALRAFDPDYEPDESFDETELLLHLIRDHPVWLHDEVIRHKFVTILETARWSLRKPDRNNAIQYLKACLIPKSPKGKVSLPPGYELAMELANELAQHLAEKCKHFVGNTLVNRKGQRIDSDTFDEIIKQARIQGEWRISTLSIDSLNSLVFNTTDFAQSLFEAFFLVSMKTIRRNQK